MLNHVAVSVPDCAAAVSWYTGILGFKMLQPAIRTTERLATPSAPMFAIYPPSLQKVKMAFLGTGNGVGFEVFEFLDPAFSPAAASFEKGGYAHGGFFHICVTDPEPDRLAERVVKEGGKKLGETIVMGEESACYVQDPWGNVIEVLSCTFEQLLANR